MYGCPDTFQKTYSMFRISVCIDSLRVKVGPQYFMTFLNITKHNFQRIKQKQKYSFMKELRAVGQLIARLSKKSRSQQLLPSLDGSRSRQPPYS